MGSRLSLKDHFQLYDENDRDLTGTIAALYAPDMATEQHLRRLHADLQKHQRLAEIVLQAIALEVSKSNGSCWKTQYLFAVSRDMQMQLGRDAAYQVTLERKYDFLPRPVRAII